VHSVAILHHLYELRNPSENRKTLSDVLFQESFDLSENERDFEDTDGDSESSAG
jgi:hypothetical protein